MAALLVWQRAWAQATPETPACAAASQYPLHLLSNAERHLVLWAQSQQGFRPAVREGLVAPGPLPAYLCRFLTARRPSPVVHPAPGLAIHALPAISHRSDCHSVYCTYRWVLQGLAVARTPPCLSCV